MAEKHLFSTGQLLVTPLALLTPIVTRTSRNGATYQFSPANLVDGDATTLFDFFALSTSNPDFVRINLGSSQAMTGLTFRNVSQDTGLPNNSIRVWVTNDASFLPGSTDGISLTVPTPTAGSVTLNFPGGEVSGRYIYIVSEGTGNVVRYGEIVPVLTTTALELALVQDATIEQKFATKDLFGPQNVSVFALDSADHEGGWTLKIGNASVNAKTLQLLIASQLAAVLAVAGPPAVPANDKNTLPGAVKLPYLQAVLSLVATDGKFVRISLRKCKASGVNWKFALTDFLAQNFELHAFPDAGGVVGTWEFEV